MTRVSGWRHRTAALQTSQRLPAGLRIRHQRHDSSRARCAPRAPGHRPRRTVQPVVRRAALRSRSTTRPTARSAIWRPGRVPARAHAPEGAARDRAGAGRRRCCPSQGIARVDATAERLSELLPRSAGVSDRATRPRRRRRCLTPAGRRRSSSTRPSTRTRPRTSATCATPRSATRSSASCASAARRSKSRTTSTTPASRSPTSSSAPRARAARRSTRCAQLAETTRFDYYCWDLYARVTEWYDEDKARLDDPRGARSTTSSTAATTPPAIGALIADRIVRATCGRWRG